MEKENPCSTSKMFGIKVLLLLLLLLLFIGTVLFMLVLSISCTHGVNLYNWSDISFQRPISVLKTLDAQEMASRKDPLRVRPNNKTNVFLRAEKIITSFIDVYKITWFIFFNLKTMWKTTPSAPCPLFDNVFIPNFSSF